MKFVIKTLSFSLAENGQEQRWSRHSWWVYSLLSRGTCSQQHLKLVCIESPNEKCTVYKQSTVHWILCPTMQSFVAVNIFFFTRY